VPGTTVVRPVVRAFYRRERRLAVDHVRAGGHAVIWEGPLCARLLLPPPDENDPHDLALYSILDLGKKRYEISRRGITKGLATALVGRDSSGIVRERIERDRYHTGATRELTLDCMECAACCYSNEVVLDKEDVARFGRAGRPELAKMPYARRRNGKLMLRLAPDGGCLQLGPGNRCNIYDVRPEMCRAFPVGSECCLSTRADDLGLYDGARPSSALRRMKTITIVP
jgi:Fe-S-cluster containining protein